MRERTEFAPLSTDSVSMSTGRSSRQAVRSVVHAVLASMLLTGGIVSSLLLVGGTVLVGALVGVAVGALLARMCAVVSIP